MVSTRENFFINSQVHMLDLAWKCINTMDSMRKAIKAAEKAKKDETPIKVKPSEDASKSVKPNGQQSALEDLLRPFLPKSSTSKFSTLILSRWQQLARQAPGLPGVPYSTARADETRMVFRFFPHVAFQLLPPVHTSLFSSVLIRRSFS